MNGDGYVSTGQGFTGNNMFAYCLNNPINCTDPSGKLAVTATVAGSAIGFVLLELGKALLGLLAGYLIADTLVNNPPASPSISIPENTKPETDEKEKDIAPTIPKNPPKKKQTVIYRYGKMNPGNFVPSDSDVSTNSGLSFSTIPPRPGQKASVTTIEALNATGIVTAYQDRPGHVRVDPVFGTLADWRAGGSTHPCTIAVKSVVVKWDGGS